MAIERPRTGRRPGKRCCAPPQADAINSILKAAGITVEPYWPTLFAKLFSKKDLGDLITNVGSGAPPPRVLRRSPLLAALLCCRT